MLTIAVSSRALFHVEEGNKLFELMGQKSFDGYMKEHENVPLKPGAAFPLVKKMLALNTPGVPRDRVEVVVLSRNSPAAGLRVMRSAAHYGLDIERAVFASGGDRFSYASAMKSDLFLSANRADVLAAMEHGIAAATLLPRLSAAGEGGCVRIAFDGDKVLYDGRPDEIFETHGLEGFRAHEMENARVPIGSGPFRSVLEKVQEVRASLGENGSQRLRIALITARGAPSHERALRTLEAWGVSVDEAVFAGGLPKGPLVRAFGADIHFDDNQQHISSTEEHDIAGGHVPVLGNRKSVGSGAAEGAEHLVVAGEAATDHALGG